MKRTITIFAALFALLAVLWQPEPSRAQTIVQHYAGGDFIYIDRALYPGNIFWVDSATGTNGSGYGTQPDKPTATIDYAIGKCTANNGDLILVMPGHSEDGVAATQIFDADVAGITIKGLGTGSDRPRLDYNFADTTATIGAANVTIQNIVFRPGITSTGYAINIEATGDHAIIENCEFAVGEASGTDEFVVAVKVSGDDVKIRGNRFYTAINDLSCVDAIRLGVGTAIARTEITDNIMYGNWSTAAITDGATAVTEINITANHIKVKDGEPGIELHANSTGILADNLIESTGIADYDAAIVAADCSWFENYAVDADGTHAKLIGGDFDLADVADAVTLIGATVDDIETKVDTVDTNVDTLILDANTIIATQALHGTSLNDIETKVDTLQAATGVGTVFMVSKALAHTAITTTGVDLTGVATGTLQLVDVIILNGSTTLDATGGASNISIAADNVQGNSDIALTSDDDIIAYYSKSLARFDTVYSEGTVLLNGKKLQMFTSTNNQTSDGNLTVYMIFRRLSAGATIAAAT